MHHLRLERNQTISKRRCGTAVLLVFNYLGSNAESFKALHRAAM